MEQTVAQNPEPQVQAPIRNNQKNKLIIAAVVLVLITALATGVITYALVKNNNDTTATITTTETTGSVTPTVTMTTTPSVTATTVTNKTFSDKNFNLSFQYPSTYTVNVVNKEGSAFGTGSEKRIEIVKNSSSKLELHYSTGGFGCLKENENEALNKVDTVFKSKDGKENIARFAISANGKTGYGYARYTTAVANTGYTGICDIPVLYFTDPADPVTNGAFYFAEIKTTNPADYTEFDTIMKTATRI